MGFLDRLVDVGIGLSRGKNWQDSLSQGALYGQIGNKIRAQKEEDALAKNQTINYLIKQGISKDDAPALLNNPDLMHRALNNIWMAKSQARARMQQQKAFAQQQSAQNERIAYLIHKGIPKEEAPFLAKNPVFMREELQELAASKRAQSMQTPPKIVGDYQVRSDPKTGELTEVPIKGSATYVAQQQRKKDTRNKSIDALDMITDTMQCLKQHPNATGGLSELWSYVPYTPQKELQSHMDELHSNVVIKTLQDIRNGSKNGASGFGSLSDNEGNLLKDIEGKLNLSRNYKNTYGVLQRLLKVYLDAAGLKIAPEEFEALSPEEQKQYLKDQEKYFRSLEQ